MARRLTTRKQGAIVAIMTNRDYKSAAVAAGVSLSTLYSWMNDPEFCRVLEDARASLIQHACDRLLVQTGAAIDTLVRNLSAAHAHNQIRAAIAILDQAAKGVEVNYLLRQVSQLRQQIRELQGDAEPRDAADAMAVADEAREVERRNAEGVSDGPQDSESGS